MPWYWILIIISAIVGPFEAMYTYNKARQRREQLQKERLAREGKSAGAAETEAESAE